MQSCANTSSTINYMDTPEFHAIPGSMIIDRFGYKECPRP
jgi:hypothetical protein